MKMIKKCFFALSIFISTVFLATACGTKLPKNEHDKVKFAFNGVEKSFKKKEISTKANETYLNSNLRMINVNNSALDAIKSVYVDSDEVENGLDGLEYTEPPMIQFQCLKSIYEKIGKDFNFGTKYYDTITGQIYLDLENGAIKDDSKDSNYLVDYEFGLAVNIQISSSDNITADVSFEIKLTKGSTTYNSKWYVFLDLNYDMKKKDPNYTLAMYTANDQKGIPYRDMYSYEYDYVEVKDNKINEWRKFEYESKTKLVKDSAHQTFKSYLDEDIDYQVGASRWYYDGKQRKVKQMTPSKAATIGTVLFEGVGLNNGDINDDAFYNKSGEQNSKIKTIYADFSKTFGKDVIYSLVWGGESKKSGYTPTTICLIDSNGGGVEGYGVKNTTIEALLSEFTDNSNNHHIVKLNYKDSSGLADEIMDKSTLTYYFTAKKKNSNDTYTEVSVNLNDEIEAAYNKLITANNITFNDVEYSFYVIVKDSKYNISGKINFGYAREDGGDTKDEFPQIFKTLGIPEYEGTSNFYYRYDGNKTVTVYDSNLTEASNYITLLHNAGFTDNDVREKWISVKKYPDSNHALYVVFDYAHNQYDIRYDIQDEQEPSYITSVGLKKVGSEDLIPFSLGEYDYYYLVDCELNAGDEFTILVSGLSDIEFGYTDIINISSEYLRKGDDNKVVVKNNAKVSLTVIPRDNSIYVTLYECYAIAKIIKGNNIDDQMGITISSGVFVLDFNTPYEVGTEFTFTLSDKKGGRGITINLTDENGDNIEYSSTSSSQGGHCEITVTSPITLSGDITFSATIVQ